MFIKNVCMFLMGAERFVGGRKIKGRGSLKFQWNLLCKQFALAATNFTQEISRCLVHIYTWGSFPKKWNLMAAVKSIRGLIVMQDICIPTFCEYLLHGCVFCFCTALFFWKESRWIGFPPMSYTKSLLNFQLYISWMYRSFTEAVL